ncbi:MAG: septal ring lytic transglycosylase RlpA family protein [Nitrospiraceae bacterium]
MDATNSTRRRVSLWLLLVAMGLTIGACSSLPKGQADLDLGVKARGIASWYGADFHGLATASGEVYDMEALTGAHRTLPLGTVVKVTNVVNGKQVLVRINDRGPYVKGRIVDLSHAAARALGMVADGITPVQLEVLEVAGYGETGWLAAVVEAIMQVRSFTKLEPRPESVDSDASRTVARWLLPEEVRSARSLRLPPIDVMRERRARRVADILAAEHRVYTTATLLV